MKVAEAPAHSGLLPPVCKMETPGVTFGFTVIVIVFDVAVVGLAQLAFDVSTQETTCPFVSVEVVKVVLFVPAFAPSTFH